MVKANVSKHAPGASIEDIRIQKGDRIYCEFQDGKTWCTVFNGPVYHDEAGCFGYDVTCDDRPGQIIFAAFEMIKDWEGRC